ncbi:hypothetical protein BC833DRAFT_568508 [Globomyces pollinis-pini]|nr:hypothetical protein BC833DRAFT_568508 [Globomyces pollinis-pini]
MQLRLIPGIQKRSTNLKVLVAVFTLSIILVLLSLSSFQISLSQSLISESEILPIVIPTFTNHFKYNIQFLESFVKNVLDFSNLLILFVVSNNQEANELLHLIYSNQKLSNALKAQKGGLYVIPVFELIQKVDKFNVVDNPIIFDGINVNEESLLKVVETFKYQSLKKLYGLKYLDTILPEYKYALIADSELTCIKKDTLFRDAIEDYFNRPTIKLFYEDFRHGQTESVAEIVREQMEFINVDISELPSPTTYMMQDQSWFVEKDMFHEYWHHIESVKSTTVLRRVHDIKGGIFFGDLGYRYYLYSQRFRKADKYKFVNIMDQFKTQKGINEAAYNLILKYRLKNGWRGAFEDFTWFPRILTKNLVDFLNENKIAFFRNDMNEECFLRRLSLAVDSFRYQACSDGYFPTSNTYCDYKKEHDLELEQSSKIDLQQEQDKLSKKYTN